MQDPKNHDTDRSHLGELYPKAKSYDELREERANVKARRALFNRAQRPWLVVTGYVLALIIDILIIVWLGKYVVFSYPFFGFPLVVLLSLVWLFCAIYLGRKVRDIIDNNPEY